MATAVQRGPTSRPQTWFRPVIVLLARPWLWATALRQAVRIARRGWWRRPPFLPLPDGGYVRFRLETAYGDAGHPDAGDLVAYLRWCRDRRR